MRASWFALAAVAGLLGAAVAFGRQPAHALALAAPSFVLLAGNLFLIRRFAAGAATEPVFGLDRQVAKWGYLLIAIVAYAWLVLTVANDWLPQKSAAAALTVALSFPAGRDLLEYADDPPSLDPAVRRSLAAALIHGTVLAAALAFL
jgi:1,4-dihydroxy-2-naphthoate octaprenyltransferase